MQTASDAFVLLKGGLAVPVAPLQLLWHLEERGLSIVIDNGDIVIRPAGHLTDDGVTALRGWKAHIRALVDYNAPEVG